MKPTKEEMKKAVKAAGWVKLPDGFYYHGENLVYMCNKGGCCDPCSLEEAYNHEITQNYLKEQTE